MNCGYRWESKRGCSTLSMSTSSRPSHLSVQGVVVMHKFRAHLHPFGFMHCPLKASFTGQEAVPHLAWLHPRPTESKPPEELGICIANKAAWSGDSYNLAKMEDTSITPATRRIFGLWSTNSRRGIWCQGPCSTMCPMLPNNAPSRLRPGKTASLSSKQVVRLRKSAHWPDSNEPRWRQGSSCGGLEPDPSGRTSPLCLTTTLPWMTHRPPLPVLEALPDTEPQG